MMNKSPVVHFEMPAEDRDRVCKFYTEAFGWDMQQLGEDMSNYVLAGTTDTGEDMMPKTPGAINGGFYLKDGASSDFNTHVVISVEDIDEAVNAVETAGGKITSEKMDIPGIGTFVSFLDSEGNNVGMLQPVAVGEMNS